MTLVKFRNPAEESGKSNDNGSVGKGHSGSEDSVSILVDKLLQAVETKASNSGSASSASNSAYDASSHYSKFGITEDQYSALQSALGDKGASALVASLSSVGSHAEKNDVLLLSEVQKLQKTLEDSIEKQTKTIEELGGRAMHSSISALGLDKVFNESNKDDLSEMLDMLTQQSNGLFDAKAEYDRRVELNDLDYLSQLKGQFESYLGSKYKDHGSISGGHTASQIASVRSSAKIEDEVVAINEQLNQLTSGPNKDFKKIAELQSQLDEKLEQLLS